MLSQGLDFASDWDEIAVVNSKYVYLKSLYVFLCFYLSTNDPTLQGNNFHCSRFGGML